MTSGADVLLHLLREEKVNKIFGNPGTTELPLMEALARSSDAPEYVLGLNEASAVGMADGYAQATGRPSFLNLHAFGGLGCAIGALGNAAAAHVPLVVTAGQQDRRHLAFDPWLAGDVVSLARPVTKWAHEVRNAGELAIMLRRAFLDAMVPPAGPVFLSLPSDILWQSCELPSLPKSSRDIRVIPADLRPLVDRLLAAEKGRLAMILCDEVATSGATRDAAAVAERLGAKVFGASLHGRSVFAAEHPAWQGTLPPDFDGIRTTLAPFNVLFVVGSRPFVPYHFKSSDLLLKGAELLQLCPFPDDLGRSFPVRLGVVGDPSESLRAVLAELPENAEVDAFAMKPAIGSSWLDRLTAAILSGLPKEGAVVDEVPLLIGSLRPQALRRGGDHYYFARGGARGWAIPASVGIGLARPGASVLCVTGDGSAMFSPQALWNAAQRNLNIVFVVLQNGEYGILKSAIREGGYGSSRKKTFIGMSINQPAIDFAAIGSAFGIRTLSTTGNADVAAKVADAFRQQGPTIIVIPVNG